MSFSWLDYAQPLWDNVSLDIWITENWSSAFINCGFKRPSVTVNIQCHNWIFTLYLTLKVLYKQPEMTCYLVLWVLSWSFKVLFHIIILRVATKCYFYWQLNLPNVFWINQKIVKKFLNLEDTFLTVKYSVSWHTGVNKPENIWIYKPS